MNKVELNFGERTLTAKFGIGFIGRYLKANEQTLNEMFKEFQENPFLTAPNLLYHSVKETGEDITLQDIEDLIDDNGGVNSPQLIAFIEAFTQSLTVNMPVTEGKPQKVKAKS